MEIFDFITSDEFRASLVADYEEMQRCHDAKAWKAVVVLAGSVVEAMLADALAATDYDKRTNKNPLEMMLADLVNTCKAEQIISQRTADLCSAVRSYRNLIHPGRIIRLQDGADENSANIAMALIPLIAREIALQREKAYGLTATQLLAKLDGDPSVMAILNHLLLEMKAVERERLLIKMIPAKRAEIAALESEPFGAEPEVLALRDRLGVCYRSVLDTAPVELKRKVAQRYVAVLKSGSATEVEAYDAAFFRCTDLQYLNDSQIPLVKGHVLSLLKSGSFTDDALELANGLEKHLEPGDVASWSSGIIRRIASDATSDGDKQDLKSFLLRATFDMEKPVQQELVRVVGVWSEHYAERDNASAAEVLESFQKTLVEYEDLPF